MMVVNRLFGGAVLLTVTSLAMAVPARADVLFSSLPFLAGGAGSSSQVSGPSSTPGYNEIAEQFTPSVTGSLNSIQVPFSYGSGANNAVTIALYSSVNDLPRTLLASQKIPANTLTSGRVLYTLNFGGTVLTAGTPYFVDAATTGDTIDGWANTSTSTTGAGALKNNFEGSFASNGVASLAFQLDGTVTSTTPEPGALALFVASGLSGAGFLIRRRRRA